MMCPLQSFASQRLHGLEELVKPNFFELVLRQGPSDQGKQALSFRA